MEEGKNNHLRLPGFMFGNDGWLECHKCVGSPDPVSTITRKVIEETHNYWKNKKKGGSTCTS
jgi:hypothetical protein